MDIDELLLIEGGLDGQELIPFGEEEGGLISQLPPTYVELIRKEVFYARSPHLRPSAILNKKRRQEKQAARYLEEHGQTKYEARQAVRERERERREREEEEEGKGEGEGEGEGEGSPMAALPGP
jgi:hypothetical protein